MCGIIGLVNSDSKSHENQALIDGLTILQHRGQDAAGIVTESNGRLNLMKNNGSVSDVFTQENIVNLRGNIGIGHVRYPTSGGRRSCEAQPLYTNFPYGIAIAHNGNLANTKELAQRMQRSFRHVNTDSDSEILLNVFADELQRRQLASITPDDIFDSVSVLMRKCKGAYAVVMLINRLGLLAFRDPHGIRPLCFGSRHTSSGIDYAVASESVAIDALDHYNVFTLARDLRAGEAIFVSNSGQIYTRELTTPNTSFTPCIFEYVYFARPDSILDGVSVYAARAGMGEKLAHLLESRFTAEEIIDIDVVIPVPETSRTAALQCAQLLHRPYREGFIKNRYIARTFIMPGQEMRKKTVRLKLNTIKSEFKHKVVLLVDDSIVRGTTAKELIQMARDAGAKKVYFASAAPPVRYCNVYGIDIPTREELVAHGCTEEQIGTCLGADRIFFNTLEDICDALNSLSPRPSTALSLCPTSPTTDSTIPPPIIHAEDVTSRFECSCFNGHYVTPEVTAAYLQALEQARGCGRTGAVQLHKTQSGEEQSDGSVPGNGGKAPADEALLQCEASDSADLLITQYVRDIVGPGRSNNHNSSSATDNPVTPATYMLHEKSVEGNDFCSTLTSSSSLCESLHNEV